mmetsp:Transcript_25094/g.56638  ORF Transcript_25094/g.56638 Transcript_25094/m.56638 type:complete len:262 (-) Transcript_25094:33-818(-)
MFRASHESVMVVVPALPPVEERYPPVVRGPAFTLKLSDIWSVTPEMSSGVGQSDCMEMQNIRQQTDPEEHVFPTQQPEQMLACLDFQLSVPQPHKIVQISELKQVCAEESLQALLSGDKISTRVLKLHSPEAHPPGRVNVFLRLTRLVMKLMEVDPVHDVLVGRRDLHSQRQHHLEQLRRLEGHMREVAVPASMRSENPPAIGGDGPEEKPLGDLGRVFGSLAYQRASYHNRCMLRPGTEQQPHALDESLRDKVHLASIPT